VLDVLAIRHKMVIGYRGGADVFLAMQRGEVQFHSTGHLDLRSRNGDFVRSGQGIGVAYLVAVDDSGGYAKSPYVTEMPAFPDLYERSRRMPSGPVLGRAQLADQPGRRDDLCGLCAARHAGRRNCRAPQRIRGRLQ